ncbi:MAG TPA: hypothetical protein VFF69_15740 [Phycisphaerales bacterium]|nr:hypothetical protein [Phycisphaerales bacterium]
MSPTFRIRQGAGVTPVALALLIVLARAAPAQPEPQSRGAACGVLTVPEARTPLARDVLRAGASLLAWSRPEPGDAWRELAVRLGADEGASAWSVLQTEGGALEPSARAAEDAEANVVFDVAFDLNGLRRISDQPFSRGGRGRALDALGIDNARRARLVGVPSPDGADQSLTLAIFSESRAGPPGRWQAVPFARVRAAPGGAGRAVIEVDFGQEWGGVLVTIADLALARANPDARSTDERLSAWGADRVEALGGFAKGLQGRVLLWRGEEPGAWCAAFPLRSGATDRTVAPQLRALFGERLEWTRDTSGRSTATLDLAPADGAHARAPAELRMRFIAIADRGYLVAAPTEELLHSAPEVLAHPER